MELFGANKSKNEPPVMRPPAPRLLTDVIQNVYGEVAQWVRSVLREDRARLDFILALGRGEYEILETIIELNAAKKNTRSHEKPTKDFDQFVVTCNGLALREKMRRESTKISAMFFENDLEYRNFLISLMGNYRIMGDEKKAVIIQYFMENPEYLIARIIEIRGAE